MSLEGDKRQAALRAMAHPVRLQILSLLTGASMTAAELARELGLTHANASYHLRNLLHGGLVVPDGEERIRGGVAKRYRYHAEREREPGNEVGAGTEAQRGLLVAFANELIRRTAEADLTTGSTVTDAELWVTPEAYQEVRDKIIEASTALHAAAQAPRTPGTVRTSTTIAMFRMEDK
ncbi:ArsR/SmtB family transcription factor [Actinoplanes sp. RD1]|uniref:ArsR/SmtB family transcription factor n=1 Tax=Actinoplanes sp. RD1 TaxID=3064538 RepID=UPI0027420D71|nr:helix-turn-helix domain-containing protein [Actinoplanes sp. RD1]